MVAGMAAAFVAGLFIETPKTTGLPYADVSRAKTFTKSVVEVDVDVLQEQLLADTTYFKTLMANALLMQYQAHTLAEAIEKTNELVGDNPAFAESVQTMNVGKQSIDNACSNLDLYVESLNSLKEKKKVKGFEQIYNNALLSYYLVSNKTGYAELFEKDAKAYLEVKEIANVEEINSLIWRFHKFDAYNEILTCAFLGHFDQESLNCALGAILNQEKLQTELDMTAHLKIGTLLDQDQLKWALNEDILKLALDQYLQSFNQEQLNIQLKHNDQEKLKSFNQDQLECTNQEQLGSGYHVHKK